MENIILKTQAVTKYFNDPIRFKVLDNIDMEVSKGEFLTMVGKSGSGKSTLLYCLSTMDTDYEGSIEILGQTITGKHVDKLAAIRNEKIGFVFQFHYLLPEFTCLKNVMIPAMKLRRFSIEEIEHRAIEKLSMLGLADQAHKPASKLSGGQQQRVSIARALINDPAIIMCDEPTGNLDSNNSKIVFDVFRQLSSEFGQTIIAVTHDNDIAANSDRTIMLEDGRILG